MKLDSILVMVKKLLDAACLWFDYRERNRRKAVINEFRKLEEAYKKALAEGKPNTAASIAKQIGS